MTGGQPRRFSRIGGHEIVDLLNTVRWRLDPDRTVDDLSEYATVLNWATEFAVITSSEAAELRMCATSQRPARLGAEHRRVVALRETVFAALVMSSHPAVQNLVTTYRSSLRLAVLVRDDTRWAWSEESLSLRTPHDRLIRRTMSLITDPAVARLHQCEDAACGWVFLDLSRQHNRRWCAAADCGNRNRARRFYRRHRAAAARS